MITRHTLRRVPGRKGRARGIALAVCVLVGSLQTRSARAQLQVDQLELTVAPGTPDRSVAVFTVTNGSPRPVQAVLTMGDWDRDEHGENRFYPVGQQAQSCRGSVHVFPAAIRLEPNQTQTIRVAADSATERRTACWTIVFIENREPSVQAGRRLGYVLRTGVKVYVEPVGLPSAGVVENMVVRPRPPATPVHAPQTPHAPVDSASQELAIVFHNSGGVHLLATGSVEFRRLDNTLVTKVPIAEFPTLPGALRELAVPIPSLAPGRYVALALIDFGGTEIAAGQIEFEAR